MDDEKSITEKLTGVISRAAGSVKSAVSHVVDTASDAAQHAMEANAQKISRIPAAKPDPERVAATANEQIYIPEASDAAAMPMPLFPAAPTPKKRKAAPKPAPASMVNAGTESPSSQAEPVNQSDTIPPQVPSEKEAQPKRVITISPRALRVAAELGVDWTSVSGSGRTGRIRERDIRAAAGSIIATR